MMRESLELKSLEVITSFSSEKRNNQDPPKNEIDMVIFDRMSALNSADLL